MQKVTKDEFLALSIEDKVDYINKVAAKIAFFSPDFYPDGVIYKENGEFKAIDELRLNLKPPVEEKLTLFAENLEIYLYPEKVFAESQTHKDSE